jgi:hypothetical protein
MADLGDVIGSLMVGVIRARRVADEHTAALAEYYKSNPLLEGLSVPRIRIPELRIEMPVIIDGQTDEQIAVMADPALLAAAAAAQLKATFESRKLSVPTAIGKSFVAEVRSRLTLLMNATSPITREAVARCIQEVSAEALSKSRLKLTAEDADAIAKDLRGKVYAAALAKEPVGAQILANVRTADVKEQASGTNVVRLSITFKEEGLEWATQSGESGGVIRTLQPE